MLKALKNVPILIVKGDSFYELISNIENLNFKLAAYSNEGSTDIALPGKVTVNDEDCLMIETNAVYDCISRRRGQVQCKIKEAVDKNVITSKTRCYADELEYLDEAECTIRYMSDLMLEQERAVENV